MSAGLATSETQRLQDIGYDYWTGLDQYGKIAFIAGYLNGAYAQAWMLVYSGGYSVEEIRPFQVAGMVNYYVDYVDKMYSNPEYREVPLWMICFPRSREDMEALKYREPLKKFEIK